MKRKTAVKMLMTIIDRNTANEYLNNSCGLTNRELVLSYINYTVIMDALENYKNDNIVDPEKIETVAERVKRLRLDKLFLRRRFYE